MIGVGLSLPQVAVRRVAAVAAGPTVILNAAYRTDTLLDQGLVPITNGGELDSWAMATGGTFNYETAFLAGASARPIWLLGTPGPGGVHTAGNNAALTCATPVTIPADTDCVIYVLANVAEYGTLIVGSTTQGLNVRIVAGSIMDPTDTQVRINLGTGIGQSVYRDLSGLYDGQMTVRFRRISGTWSAAATGVAEGAMTADGSLPSAAIVLDTLLGTNSGGGLNEFSGAACYLQKAKIWINTSSPDTAYETANGGTL